MGRIDGLADLVDLPVANGEAIPGKPRIATLYSEAGARIGAARSGEEEGKRRTPLFGVIVNIP